MISPFRSADQVTATVSAGGLMRGTLGFFAAGAKRISPMLT